MSPSSLRSKFTDRLQLFILAQSTDIELLEHILYNREEGSTEGDEGSTEGDEGSSTDGDNSGGAESGSCTETGSGAESGSGSESGFEEVPAKKEEAERRGQF